MQGPFCRTGSSRTIIGYATVGTNDKDAAIKFYDAVLGEMGGVGFQLPANNLYGYTHATEPSPNMLVIATPYDGQPASPGNGNMISLMAKDKESVDRVYAKALEMGAKDTGDGGPSTPDINPGFYAGYFRDLDGNKLCVMHLSDPSK